MYEYFHISVADLGKDAKVPVLKLGDSGEVFYEIAMEMVNTIKANNAAGKHTVFICPVGPVGQYPIFVRLVNRDRISLKNCWFINMDEYLTDEGEWVDKSHPLSFRGFMDRTVYTRIDPALLMDESQRIFPDPHDPEHIQRVIETLGGVDVAFGGIGITDEFAALPTRVLTISRETRTTNAIGDYNGAIDAMPRKCVTIGMKQILSAKKIRLGVFRDWHRAVVRQTAYGEVSAHFPATLIQRHPDAMVIANANASQQPF